ncbi:anaerobic ribonucleoside-triphosphate reductase activating protein [Halorhodospira halochloris]|uniref:anaerobic ribonucleoside-triphosphate reductase activating protein n=1 Tax=Halorhodospira halochloris TaxID=1052 RepID=UPI001EE965D8|nr:anaerobic ribonucleoside-triphosphate reductase activating protein [Halorhodospira halochloris]MCG5530496.1 anaerobic ribonucleoside-triphosphate reductase activating protein [Halorhodospira halochloris]MCG5549367.1 anaerobic ribonucleoside-triphosphate reductase activating protein [Halorhodospira halochloris]
MSLQVLRVGGMTPCSTVDFPDALAAVIYCQGCPWRCHYCHNPELLPARGENQLDWADLLAWLRRRQGLLDAVVFSGGEPTMQPGIVDAVKAVHDLGFKVGLHTAGSYPQRLQEVLAWVDWVAMDIKGEWADYPEVTGVANSAEKARVSVEAVKASGVAYELRVLEGVG